MNIRKHVANQLKTARQQRGWTQTQLANELGSSQQEIALIEKGDRNLTIETIKAVAEKLNHTVKISIEGPPTKEK